MKFFAPGPCQVHSHRSPTFCQVSHLLPGLPLFARFSHVATWQKTAKKTADRLFLALPPRAQHRPPMPPKRARTAAASSSASSSSSQPAAAAPKLTLSGGVPHHPSLAGL